MKEWKRESMVITYCMTYVHSRYVVWNDAEGLERGGEDDLWPASMDWLIGLFIYLFIYGLFKDTASSSKYIASDDGMISERDGKNMGWSGRGPI